MDQQENSAIIQPAPPGTMLLTFGLDGGVWHELTTVIAFVIEPDESGRWCLANVVTTVVGEELYPEDEPSDGLVPIEDRGFARCALVIGGRVALMGHEYDSIEAFLTSMRKWKGLANYLMPRGLPPADRAKWIEGRDFRDML